MALHNLRALQAEGAAGQLAQVSSIRFLSGGSRGTFIGWRSGLPCCQAPLGAQIVFSTHTLCFILLPTIHVSLQIIASHKTAPGPCID